MNQVENVDYLHEGKLTNRGVELLDTVCERLNDSFVSVDASWCVLERYVDNAAYLLEVAREKDFSFGLQAYLLPEYVAFTPYIKINGKEVYFNDSVIVRKVTYDYQAAIDQLLQIVWVFSLGAKYVNEEALEHARRDRLSSV